MPFDRQLAEQHAHATKSRDAAPFFVGRQKEINTFGWALTEAKEYDAASFRIFQGPPGCGKTSLANHLAGKFADEVLFVPCGPSDLKNTTALLKKMREFALAQKGAAEQLGGAVLKTATEYFKLGTLSEAVRDVMERTGPANRCVVLHVDEAHGRVGAGYTGVDETLLDLHTVGIGAPCVVLLTGLGHTYDAVTSIKGLTRLDDNATHEVGTLSKRDCARSTNKMLAALNAVEPTYLRDRLATLTGELAHGWPAHLTGAQAALCEELVRVDGDLRDVNASAVRDRSDQKRFAYYRRRLRDHPALHINPSVTQRILVDVARAKPKFRAALDPLCEAAIDRESMRDAMGTRGVTPSVVADALLEKGIVRETDKNIAPSIPSMADWAAVEIGVEPPRREPIVPSSEFPP